MRIALTTLGCKINQFESESLRQDLLARGGTVVPFDEEADVYIINTCTVTARSDQQCRQLIRSASRRAQGARILVTGCYAETRPEELRAIPGVTHVLGNRDKGRLPDHVIDRSAVRDRAGIGAPSFVVQSNRSRTRGFLKIQDGCNNRCSYCIVPSARGASRSALPEDVAAAFHRLIDDGCPEIVLTGIHIGTYGSDLVPVCDLGMLLARLRHDGQRSRIRLSSIEPTEVTENIISLLGNGLCRHLHIPLQSGSDEVLRAMNRGYSSDFYGSLLRKLTERIPGLAIGTDIIVGFPGETEVEFSRTVAFLERQPLTHFHIFTYSPRPGTPAERMHGQVREADKKKRSRFLHQLASQKNLLFRQSLKGKHVDVVIEGSFDKETGCITGLTDNYIRVQIYDASRDMAGRVVSTVIDRVTEQYTYGKIA